MTDPHAPASRTTSSPPTIRARVVTTLLTWGSVYTLLLSIFTLFDDQLSALPSALRLLVVSGVLVALMANLVMPAVTRLVHHRRERG